MVHPGITPRTCEVCRKGEAEVTLQRCSTCKEHNYCSEFSAPLAPSMQLTLSVVIRHRVSTRRLAHSQTHMQETSRVVR